MFVPSIHLSEINNSLSLNHNLLDIFPHGLLIAQCHVVFSLLLLVQRVIHDLLCLFHFELVGLYVFVSADAQGLQRHLDMLELQGRHVLEQPIELGRALLQLELHCHVHRVVRFLQALEDLLEVTHVAAQLKLLEPLKGGQIPI